MSDNLPNKPRHSQYSPKHVSQYEIIWRRLKAKERVVLSVEPEDMRALKRMIEKRKYVDTAFKIMNYDNWRLHYKYDAKKKILVVELKTSLGIFDKVI